MHHVEQGHNPLGLAALNVTDHVPVDITWQGRYLAFGLLDAIFAKVAQSQVVGCLDHGLGLGLGHSHQRNPAWVTPGPLGSRGDPVLHRTQIGF